jgi:hypothetical protein
MSAIASRLHAQARIVPMQPENRVQHVEKLESGGLCVTLHSGESYELDKGDELFQAFVIYTILAEV